MSLAAAGPAAVSGRVNIPGMGPADGPWSARVARRSAARSLYALALAAFALQLVLAVSGVVGDRPLFFCAFVGLPALLVWLGMALEGWGRRRLLRIVDGELRLSRWRRVDERLPRAESGTVLPMALRQILTPGLRVHRGDRVDLELADGRTLVVEGAGPELLARAGVEPGRASHRYRAEPSGQLGVVVAVMAAAGFGFMVAVGPLSRALGPTPSAVSLSLLAAVAVLVPLGAALVLARAPDVTVGLDVLAVRRGLGAVHIPLDEITDVAWSPRMLRVTTRSGAVVRAADVCQLVLGEVRGALVRRFEEVRDARAQLPTAAQLDALDRRAAPLAAWVARVRQLGDPATGYREVALSRELLLAVLESPRAAAVHRVGAAIALAELDRTAAAARIEAALRASADEPLRRALGAVVRGEPESDEIDEATRG